MDAKHGKRRHRDANGKTKVVEINRNTATIHNTERVLVQLTGYALLEKDSDGDFQLAQSDLHIKNRDYPGIGVQAAFIWAELRDGTRVGPAALTVNARAMLTLYLAELELKFREP